MASKLKRIKKRLPGRDRGKQADRFRSKFEAAGIPFGTQSVVWGADENGKPTTFVATFGDVGGCDCPVCALLGEQDFDENGFALTPVPDELVDELPAAFAAVGSSPMGGGSLQDLMPNRRALN